MPTTAEIHLSVTTALDQLHRGYPGHASTTLCTLKEALESDGTSLGDVEVAPARSSDPATSKAAAKMPSPTNHLGLLVRAFWRYPDGLTARDACAIAGISESASPWKRVSELKAAKIIEPVDEVLDPSTHRWVERYRLTPFGYQEWQRLRNEAGGEAPER